MKIFLASPMGFCAGVDRAIKTLNLVIEKYQDVYVYNYIVHNEFIIKNFENKGVRFITSLEDIPEGAVVVFSAHGVSPSIVEIAVKKNLKIFDATCPLVSKIHTEIKKASSNGKSCILIGHKNHPEVQGTIGHFAGSGELYLVENQAEAENLKVADSQNLFLLTQTTLSVRDTAKIIDTLESSFPKLESPNKKDICYATENRQNALINLANNVDSVLIIGSKKSSNTMRLVELSKDLGKDTHLVISPEEVAGLELGETLGITAGASTPDELIEEILGVLLAKYPDSSIDTIEYTKENMDFALPKGL